MVGFPVRTQQEIDFTVCLRVAPAADDDKENTRQQQQPSQALDSDVLPMPGASSPQGDICKDGKSAFARVRLKRGADVSRRVNQLSAREQLPLPLTKGFHRAALLAVRHQTENSPPIPNVPATSFGSVGSPCRSSSGSPTRRSRKMTANASLSPRHPSSSSPSPSASPRRGRKMSSVSMSPRSNKYTGHKRVFTKGWPESWRYPQAEAAFHCLPNQAQFWCAYDYLLRHCPEKFKTLGHLEEANLRSVRELREAREKAGEDLQPRQASEMEKVMERGDDIEQLVHQHVAEMEALDRKFNHEISELQASQLESFRDLILDLHEAELQAQEASPASSSAASPKSSPSNLLRQGSPTFLRQSSPETEIHRQPSTRDRPPNIHSLSSVNSARTPQRSPYVYDPNDPYGDRNRSNFQHRSFKDDDRDSDRSRSIQESPGVAERAADFLHAATESAERVLGGAGDRVVGGVGSIAGGVGSIAGGVMGGAVNVASSFGGAAAGAVQGVATSVTNTVAKTVSNRGRRRGSVGSEAEDHAHVPDGARKPPLPKKSNSGRIKRGFGGNNREQENSQMNRSFGGGMERGPPSSPSPSLSPVRRNDANLPGLREHLVSRVNCDKVHFILRLYAGDLLDTFTFGTCDDDDDGAGPQLPSWFTGTDSHQHAYVYNSGYPIAPSRRARLRTRQGGPKRPNGPPPEISTPSVLLCQLGEPRIPPRLSSCAYAATLNAVLLPIPSTLRIDAGHHASFAKLCEASTDIHFQSFENQLAAIRDLNPPLAEGDYFVTRHSNMGGTITVVFHLLVPSDESPDAHVPQTVLDGLGRILRVCAMHAVNTLSLPLLLLDGGPSETTLPHTVAGDRVKSVLKALNQGLCDVAREHGDGGALQTLKLILPPTSVRAEQGIRQTVMMAARAALLSSFMWF